MKVDFFYSPLYATAEWIVRFAIANLLWIILNIPIIFIIINIFYSAEIQRNLLWLIVGFIILPFTFYPTTQVLFSLARDWVLKKEGSNVFKLCWYHYKNSYKKSLFGGVLLSGLWLIWLVDFIYFSQSHLTFMITFIFTGTILFVYTIIFFSVNAHYDLTLRQIFKKTLLFTIASPLLFFILLISNLLMIIISFFVFNFLIVFLLMSLIAYVSFYAFYKRILNLSEKV